MQPPFALHEAALTTGTAASQQAGKQPAEVQAIDVFPSSGASSGLDGRAGKVPGWLTHDRKVRKQRMDISERVAGSVTQCVFECRSHTQSHMLAR